MDGWGGLHSYFCVQPNFSVEVVLWMCCAVVRVVTKIVLDSSRQVVVFKIGVYYQLRFT